MGQSVTQNDIETRPEMLATRLRAGYLLRDIRRLRVLSRYRSMYLSAGLYLIAALWKLADGALECVL